MALTRITTDGITDGSILNADINSSAAIALSKLSTSGTASSSTYLRGDGAWSAVASGVDSDSEFNTIAGTDAGDNITSGSAYRNTIFGYKAGEALTTGDTNILIGAEAGKANQSNSDIIAIGRLAVSTVSTSDAGSHIGIGNHALENITTECCNLAIGHYALNTPTGSKQNVAIGHNAARALTDGQYVTAIGNDAARFSTTGGYSVSVGYRALYTNSTSSGNTALGYEAGKASTGQRQVFIGYQAGKTIAGENGNVVIGYQALDTGVGGSGSTIIGDKAGREISDGNNTIIGSSAGSGATTLTHGSNNILIGAGTNPSSGTVDNEITLGNDDVTKFRVPGINFTVKDTTATEDYVLTVDANGEAGWEAVSASDSTKMPLAGGTFTGNTLYNDNVKAKFGTGSDFEIYHDGTNNYLVSGTGLIRLRHSSEDAIITNANGGVELYWDNSKKFETISTGAKVTGRLDVDGDLISYSANNNSLGLTGHRWNDLFIANDIDILDNGKLLLGTGDDLQLYHDGTDSWVKNVTGKLRLCNTNGNGNSVKIGAREDQDSIIVYPLGATEIYHNGAKRFDTLSDGVRISSNSNDAKLIITSTNQDGAPVLQFAADNGDDNDDYWRLRADGGGTALSIQNYASGSWESNIVCRENGDTELRYDNSKKLHTHTGGVTVTGYIQMDGTEGSAAAGNIYIEDNGKAVFGDGSDLQIYHDGNHNILLGVNGADFKIKDADHNSAIFDTSAGVELFYDNSKKFETLVNGARVNDWNFELKASSGEARLALIGNAASSDAQWFRLTSYNGVSKWQNMYSGGWETNIECNGNGNVELYYDGGTTPKFETTSIGATLTGRLLVNNDTHGQYPVEVKNSNGNFIAGIYESSSGDGRHGMFYLNSNGGTNHVKLSTNGTSWLTGGNVGIGTTSPTSKLQVNDTNPSIAEFYHSDGGTNDEARISLGAYSSNPPAQRGITLVAKNNGAGHDFIVNTSNSHSLGPTEKMRVNSAGHFCVGTAALSTTSTDPGFAVDPDGAIVCRRNGTMVMLKSIGTGGYTAISILSANTQVGSCTFNSGGTSWNTSSDYRLKENQVAISDGITRLKTLKPYRFNFKENPSETVDGFFAHEVSPAVPEAITGTKDAVATDDDAAEHDHLSVGDPIYQQIDQSKLVPLLTAALQEAIGRIEELETKVAALGG